MFKSCPISTRKMDYNIARFISAQVALATIVLIITKLPIFAIILFLDFSIRALRKPSLSPFFMISKLILSSFHLKPKMGDEAPKRFALFMGLIMSLLLCLLYGYNYELVATIIASVLLVCALMEATFNYCVGCKIYQIIKALSKNTLK